MTTVAAVAFENVTPGLRFMEYRPEADLRLVGVFAVERDPNPKVMLERHWEVGNTMAPDATGVDWPRDRRSMCVGDVAVIDGAAYAVAPFGWDLI